jgi:hypothetical protein
MSHKTMGRNRTGKSLERQSSFIVRWHDEVEMSRKRRRRMRMRKSSSELWRMSRK